MSLPLLPNRCSSMKNSLPVLILTTFCALASMSSSAVAQGCEDLGWQRVRGLLIESTTTPVAEDLVQCEQIALSALSIEAWRVRFRMRTPALEIMAIMDGSDLAPISRNKQLLPGWSKLIDGEIAMETIDEPNRVDPHRLASDFTRVFVDSDPRYGIVLANRDDIPVSYESSDRYRDVRKMAQEPGQIRSILLEAAPQEVSPPKIIGRKLVFFTWGYFGGEVIRWTFSRECDPSLQREILATKVGSFDYYF